MFKYIWKILRFIFILLEIYKVKIILNILISKKKYLIMIIFIFFIFINYIFFLFRVIFIENL